jgi:parallel beta-helix repeat protein
MRYVRPQARPTLERLEDRLALSTFTVVNTNDSGSGSLRQAILDANANVGADTIAFAIGGGAQTIALKSYLPPITDTVTLDGTTQPGFNGTPLIVVSGAAIQVIDSVTGIDVEANSSTVRGLALIHFDSNVSFQRDGAIIVDGNNNVISGNYIGLDANGIVAGNNHAAGIEVLGSNNVIGGTTAADRNVVSADFIGIVVGGVGTGAGTIVEGNYIGTDPTGTRAIGNYHGIDVYRSPNVTVGGTAPGAGNLVVGTDPQQYNGINLIETTGALVAGNLLGTDFTGRIVLGNPFSQGLFFGFSHININGGSGNTIGGATSAAANVIASGDVAIISSSGNLVQRNYIGTGIDGITALGGGTISTDLGSNDNVISNNLIANSTRRGITVGPGTGNRISQNSMFANRDIAISLGYEGYVANDSKGHSGPNNYQNFPVITSTSTAGGQTAITGTLNSTPATTFTLEFFASDQEPSGYVEGKTFLGSMPVTTDASGQVSFTFTGPASSGPLFTTTATDPAGNTSEFWQPDRPAPRISGVNPPAIPEAPVNRTVTISGANFFTTSMVAVNGSLVDTTYVSPTQLQATYVAAAAAITPDEGIPATITVINPGPGGGMSNALIVPIGPALLPDGTRGTPNQRFVSELYEDLLGRPVDAAGLAHWSGLLDQGTPRQQVVSAIENSTEYRNTQVQAIYTHYLHRSADTQGLAGFVSVLQHGGTVEQVIAFVAGSPEYYQRAGGTNDVFLKAIYADVLNRAPDANSQAAFSRAMAAGLSPMAVVSFMVASQEYQQNLVRGYYTQYLDRPADSAGLNAFANQLQHGMLDEDVIAEIVAALEYFNKTVA